MLTVLWTIAAVFFVLGLLTIPFGSLKRSKESHVKGAANGAAAGIGLLFDAVEAIPAMILTVCWGISGLTGGIALLVTLLN